MTCIVCDYDCVHNVIIIQNLNNKINKCLIMKELQLENILQTYHATTCKTELCNKAKCLKSLKKIIIIFGTKVI